MNFIYRIGIGSIACIAVACSKDATESAAPVAEPETVIIGCAGAAGADVDVRTELENDGLSVRWADNDEIRLWARESGATGFLTGVQNVPFKFAYYSPSWSRAGFKGTIDLGTKEAPTFKAYRTYDYFAVSPAPASVVETRATYTIPAVQTGKFDGCCDIMTAQLRNAKGLKAGDDNPSINLVFHHHIHLLKFTILSSAWPANRPIRAVELTFPCAVVGQLTVDATGETPDNLSALADDKGEGKKVLIEFPKGQEKNVKDTFYAMIVPPPTGFGSNTKIEMRIIGTTGETSADVPIADKDDNTDNEVNQTLAAGHSTLIKLNVEAMNNLYKTVTLKFNVSDGAGGMGENTLGERVNTVRVIGPAGAFSKAVDWSEGCSVSEKERTVSSETGEVKELKSVLTCTVPSTGGDGIYSLTFLPEKGNEGYQGLDELMTDEELNKIFGQTLEVEYESDRALIKSQKDWKPVQTKTITEFDGSDESVNTLSVPYLFEEDFINAQGLESKGTYVLLQYKAKELGDQYFDSPGWTGVDVTGANGHVEILHKIHYTQGKGGATYERYYGRLDSSDVLAYLNTSSKVNIHVSFEYGGLWTEKEEYTCQLYYDMTSTMGKIEPYYHITRDHNLNNKVVTDFPIDLPSEKTTESHNFDNCTKSMRLSWQMTVSGEHDNGWVGWGDRHFSIKIMNVRVSLR